MGKRIKHEFERKEFATEEKNRFTMIRLRFTSTRQARIKHDEEKI